MKKSCSKNKRNQVLLALFVLILSGWTFALEEPSIKLSVDLQKITREPWYTYQYKVDAGQGGHTDAGESFGSETEKSQYFTTNSYTLDITISNRDGQAGTCQMEWYFIAEKITGNGNKGYNKELEVVGRGKKKITLSTGNVTKESATYDFASEETYTVGTFEIEVDPETGKLPDWAPGNGIDEWDYEAGNFERYAGYLVLITANGQVIAQDSNSSIFLKDKWIDKCRNAPRKGWKAKDPEWETLYNKWF